MVFAANIFPDEKLVIFASLTVRVVVAEDSRGIVLLLLLLHVFGDGGDDRLGDPICFAFCFAVLEVLL